MEFSGLNADRSAVIDFIGLILLCDTSSHFGNRFGDEK